MIIFTPYSNDSLLLKKKKKGGGKKKKVPFFGMEIAYL